MEQEIVPVITLSLGGKTRNLKFDFNALAAMEQATGKSFTDATLWTKIGAGSLRTMLWAALLHESPDLTEKEVGTWVSMGNLKEVMDAVSKAMTLSLAEIDPNAGETKLPLVEAVQ